MVVERPAVRGNVAIAIAFGAGYSVLFAIAFLLERGLLADALARSAARSWLLLRFAAYAAVFVGVALLYGCLLLRLHHNGVSERAWRLMLGIAVLLHVALWVTPPFLS